MENKISQFINQVLDIVFPIQCLDCKQEGRWICDDCLKQINISSEPACIFCHEKNSYGQTCDKCQQQHQLAGVFIALSYDQELVKQAIKTLKYRFVKDISQELSKFLILFLQEKIKSANFLNLDNAPKILADLNNTIIIPVPLHSRRERWRGFNQAKALALPVAEKFNLTINTQDLQRVRYTTSQAQSSAKDRQTNLKNSFTWQGENLQSKNIILVDDVATTGVTLEECAKALKQVGAGEIWGLVVAKN